MGVAVVGITIGRRRRVPAAALADALGFAATPGIFFVRIANFIRGELYGRVVGPDAWFGIHFPSDPEAHRLLGVERLDARPLELALMKAHADGTWDRVKAEVPLRHPSQLYEAALEGPLLALVLIAFIYIARKRAWRLSDGAVFGVFLGWYGLGRFALEWVREPDSQLGTLSIGLTMGQLLCSAMVLASAVLLLRARKRGAKRGEVAWILSKRKTSSGETPLGSRGAIR